MALKELLQQNRQEEAPAAPSGAASPGGDGLIAQICGEIGPSAGDDPRSTAGAEGGVQLPDGYLRRSPVQALRTPPDYGKKRAGRAALIAAGLCLLALLGLALLKSGLFRLP